MFVLALQPFSVNVKVVGTGSAAVKKTYLERDVSLKGVNTSQMKYEQLLRKPYTMKKE